MNRVVRTAVAVTAFGLAAALAAPAQAEVQYNTARYDGPGGGTTSVGSPITGLLGGLVGGGLLNGLLAGGTQAKSAARPMTEAELDAAAKSRRGPRNKRGYATTPNAAEDATHHGGALPELSPIVGGFSLGGGGLTESLPVPVLAGAARLAEPVAPSVKGAPQDKKQVVTEGSTLRGTYDAATGLLKKSVGEAMNAGGATSVAGTVNKVNSGGLLPDPATGLLGGSTATVKTLTGATGGVGSLSAENVVAGLGQAAKRALPMAAGGRLSPTIGQVAPAEMAPVIEALPGTTRAASVDELTPLVEDASGLVAANGTKATSSYGDVLTALGWTTDALTSSVRDSWVRD